MQARYSAPALHGWDPYYGLNAESEVGGSYRGARGRDPRPRFSEKIL